MEGDLNEKFFPKLNFTLESVRKSLALYYDQLVLHSFLLNAEFCLKRRV